MPGSKTTQGRQDTRAGVSDHIAFRVTYGVGTLGVITFAARWLAYTLPCRRFADILADICARLGASADRYSFTATDFHRLLLAGLPAHKPLIFQEFIFWTKNKGDPRTRTAFRIKQLILLTYGAKGQNRTADTRIFSGTRNPTHPSHRVAVRPSSYCGVNNLAAQGVSSRCTRLHSSTLDFVTPA